MKIRIWVIPRASRNKLEKIEEKHYKVHLTTPPINGKANTTLIKFLSKQFKIPKSSIRIISGMKSRDKIIEIPD